MKVTFVSLGCEQLPVSLLAALARREGHDVNLAFSLSLFDDRFFFQIPTLAKLLDDRQNAIDAIVRQQPDVIACSVLTNTYQWMLGIAREAKELVPGVKIVFGGVHPSAVPDVVLAEPAVDYVCVGEGDVAFVELLLQIERGGPTAPIPNLRFKAPDGSIVRGPQTGFIQDLDSLPFFDKLLWEDHIRIGDVYMTMATRGCPYRCTFCFNNFFARLPDGRPGKYVRQRSVDHMMGELRAAKRRYKLRFVSFEDDVFTVDKEWLRKFLDEYKRDIDLPFQCLTHPKYVDEDVARWLKEAGCCWTQMGIQTVDEEFKLKTLKRYESNDHVFRAMDALKRYGVHVKADHIFGLPGEPEGAQESARKLYAESTPSRIGTFWATYFPATDMVKQGLELGLIDDEDVRRIEQGDLQIFHVDGSVKGAEKYRSYELLFRLMPLLPPALRSRVTPEMLQHVPSKVSYVTAFALDALNGAAKHSHDHWSYGFHYLHHLANRGAQRLGFGFTPATRPIDKPPPAGGTPPPSEPSVVRLPMSNG